MKRYLSILLVSLAISGCAQIPSYTNPPASHAVEALNAFHWQLTDAVDGHGKKLQQFLVQDGKPVQIDFNTDTFSITNTCNTINGQYLLTKNAVTFSNMLSTRMLCASEQLNALDQNMAELFQHAADITITVSEKPELMLYFRNGTTLALSGSLKDSLRYGGSGETVFMEISDETVACDSATNGKQQCLKVRDVFYNDNGIKTGTSEWKLFTQKIRGYQHQNGIGHILRLKRYDAPSSQNSTSQQVYVLDMVVQ